MNGTGSNDYDDIMSQIMHGNGHRTARPLPPAPKHVEPAPRPPVHKSRPAHLTHPITYTGPTTAHLAQKPIKSRNRRRRALQALLIPIIVALGGTGGYVLWQGPVQQLLYPSPFTKEVKQASSFPLYYPTALPNGYQIRKEAIQPPTSGVVVYAIGNGKNQIAVTLQKKPDGLNLDPVLKAYTNLGKVETLVGTAHVGLDDTGAIIAHVLTPQTWMIMNTDAQAMPREDFETILKSLKQG